MKLFSGVTAGLTGELKAIAIAVLPKVELLVDKIALAAATAVIMQAAPGMTALQAVEKAAAILAAVEAHLATAASPASPSPSPTASPPPTAAKG